MGAAWTPSTVASADRTLGLGVSRRERFALRASGRAPSRLAARCAVRGCPMRSRRPAERRER
eukprot:2358040-Prymnesium_polylepis.1